MSDSLKPEDLKVGDVLVMRVGLRRLDVKVLAIDLPNQLFLSDFGPVPFTSLAMLARKEINA